MNDINILAGLCLPVFVVLEELEREVKKFSVENVLLEWYLGILIKILVFSSITLRLFSYFGKQGLLNK